MINLNYAIKINGILPIYLIEYKRYDNWVFINRGWGNGYVGIPSFHPYFGKTYEELKFIKVHGEITYSQLDKDSGLWILGFDTGHRYLGDTIETCPYEFVLNEAINLREQCINEKEFQIILKLNNLKNLFFK